MSTWIGGLFAVAAMTVTYFACIRPHRRGPGHCAAPVAGGGDEEPELTRQAGGEPRSSRAPDALTTGPEPRSKPAPPAEI